MTKLLYVEASPRGHDSKSIQMADAYLAAIREQNPGLEIDTLRLWEEKLPEFDGNKAAAKMNIISGRDLNAEQRTAWDEIVEITNRFISADRYLFAAPMWNGGNPYRLKLYIDIIQPAGSALGSGGRDGIFWPAQEQACDAAADFGSICPSLPVPGVRRRPSFDLHA
jgi:FMN-dependent NADH-azoreductase